MRTALLLAAMLAPLTVSLAPSAILHHRQRHHHPHHYPTQIIHSHPSSHQHQLPSLSLSSTTPGAGGDIATSIIDTKAEADDLTKEELLLRLSETRDYYRQRPEEGMTQKAVCLKLLSTRLPNLRLDRSHVATSTIPNAGYGLFASRDINDGELITLYPGDAVLSKSEVEEEDLGLGLICSVMFGAQTLPERRDTNRVLSHEARGYEMEISAYTSIVGDPSIGLDNAYNGHFANDGGYLTEFDDAGRKAYEKETLARFNAANFVMEGAHMGTVATKPIKKGDEVFLSYGEGYWLSRSDSTDSSSAGKNERADILGEIETNMEERRKIKRATTLTAASASGGVVGRSSSDGKSGGVEGANDDGNGVNKKSKKKKKKNSRDGGGAKTKGFGK